MFFANADELDKKTKLSVLCQKEGIELCQTKIMIRQGFLLFVVTLIFVCKIAGQNSPQNPLPAWVLETNRERQDFNKMSGLDANGNLRQTRNEGIGVRRRTGIKLSKKDKQKFAPLAADFETYAEFLKQSKSGLVRMLDLSDCPGENGVVTKTIGQKCENDLASLFGNSFSFRANDHTFAKNADLSIKNGFFISPGEFVQTLIYNMGNFPLENVLPTSKSFITLNEFVCATRIDEATIQYESLQNGLKVGNFYFKNSSPLILNSTYILRSIGFRPPKNSFVLDDKRDDIILAFRVVRKDSDDSITLLWKELSRKVAPKLIYSEND